MTPFASVAMLEKLALLKIARCRAAPALSNASSGCLGAVLSVPPVTSIRVLITSFPLVMALPGTFYSSNLADRLRGLKIMLRASPQQSPGADVAYTAYEGSGRLQQRKFSSCR